MHLYFAPHFLVICPRFFHVLLTEVDFLINLNDA